MRSSQVQFGPLLRLYSTTVPFDGFSLRVQLGRKLGNVTVGSARPVCSCASHNRVFAGELLPSRDGLKLDVHAHHR